MHALTRDERKHYRIFISYSHEDREIAAGVDAALRENGISPMWDEQFSPGQGFPDQVRKFIANSHVFLPILTAGANQRSWVHEEIGYALALNVPVLPLAIGELPGEMIHQLHAIRLPHGSETTNGVLPQSAIDYLRRAITPAAIENLIRGCLRAPERIPFACASLPDARAKMLVDYADEVRSLGAYGLVRQKGALSSFHIPVETTGHAIWADRYKPEDRSDEHCELQRDERLALFVHAEAVGCRLIVNPFITYERYHPYAKRIRLQCLYDFLASMSDEKCEVAINPGGDEISNTYVGDWFAAESVRAVGGKGYYQTIFTRHAAHVGARIDRFDAEFNELLRVQQYEGKTGVKPRESRRSAMAVIAAEIAAIPDRAAASGV